MGFKIPLFDLNYDEKEIEAVVSVLESKWISCGPKCEELENLFADMIGVKYALSLSNCTAALHLALLSAGIGEGDEVIVPSLTFVATVNAIRYVGAIPVFCDIASTDNLCISPEEIKKCISDKTKAIMVMHYGGYSCDMDEIMKISRDYNIKVIEDACHGPLSEYKGQKVGSFGVAGCFSFFSNKNISTAEGGLLVTNDEDVYKKAKLLRSHGMTVLSYEKSKGHSTSYDVMELGHNYRFNDILASIGIEQLKKLPKDIERRNKVRERYISQLKDNEKLIIPFEKYEYVSSSYIFPVVLKDFGFEKRDKIRAILQDNGIQTSMHYPPAHRFSLYEDFRKELPVTENVADNEITLPMYGSLKEEDIDYICEVLNRAVYEVANS